MAINWRSRDPTDGKTQRLAPSQAACVKECNNLLPDDGVIGFASQHDRVAPGLFRSSFAQIIGVIRKNA
jgi:hypothetical protein